MSNQLPSNQEPTNQRSGAAPPPPETIVMPLSLIRQERRVRSLILDYALGTSILGLIPIPGLFSLKLLLAAGCILKMMWDIGKLWGFRKGQDGLAIVGDLFGGIGALAMAFTAWLTFFGLGVFVPYLRGLSLAAALFTLTWAIGQATKQFYASGMGQKEETHEN